MSRLRIGFDTHGCQGLATGLGRYCASLLAAWHDRSPRPDIHILGLEEDAKAFGMDSLGGFSWHIGPSWHRRALADIAWHVGELPFLAKDLGLDVLLVHSERRLPPWFPIPVVATVHDLAAQELPGKYRGLSQIWSGTVVPHLLRRARHLLAVSKTTRDRLVDLVGIGPDRIRVVLNGVDAERFRRHGLVAQPAYPPILLFPGRIEHPAKNHVTAIAAVARLKDRGINVRLVCAGRDWLRAEEVRRAVTDHGVTDRVIFTGYISDPDLVQWYHRASLLIFPSRVEGFGLPLVEAMAADLPIVASKTSCIPEIAGEAALYADPDDPQEFADQVVRILADAELRDALIMTGRQRLLDFSWNRAAGETLQAVEAAARGQW